VRRQAQAASSRRLIHLDALRGLAALLVLVGHLRSFLFPAWSSIPRGPILALFYGATSLAHPAVIVFFVLSGYLVGGPALGRAWTGRWSASRYAVHRLTRLWVVLVPALALTLAWDAIGQAVNRAAYQGAYAAILTSGPTSDHPAVHGWSVALGNLAGLQSLIVPVFGSNGPLWSLANESWYYVLGGLLATAVAARGRPLRRSAVIVLVACGSFLAMRVGLIGGAAIWLAGAGAERLRAWLRPASRWAWFLAGVGILVVIAIVVMLSHHAAWDDALVGAAAALAVPCLASAPPLGGAYHRAATWMSDISYTLYLTHFPVAFALYACFAAPRRTATWETAALFVAAAVALVLYATALWWLIERHTPAIRRWAEARVATTSDFGGSSFQTKTSPSLGADGTLVVDTDRPDLQSDGAPVKAKTTYKKR
jgi:peptidoglycan/LPS O-acetylase OafA/YrhL